MSLALLVLLLLYADWLTVLTQHLACSFFRNLWHNEGRSMISVFLDKEAIAFRALKLGFGEHDFFLAVVAPVSALHHIRIISVDDLCTGPRLSQRSDGGRQRVHD